jgi:hypothetical protein
LLRLIVAASTVVFQATTYSSLFGDVCINTKGGYTTAIGLV